MADDTRGFAIDIIVICTANQARSPAAAVLFRREAAARLGSDHGLVIRSAGVHTTPGQPVLPNMAAALDRRGMEVDQHRSRPMRAEELEASHLVIAMTEEHRRAVNRMAPTVVSRSYTLCEIDRLVSSAWWEPTWDGSDNAIDMIRRLRPVVPRPKRSEDIIDPAGHSVEIAVAVLAELADRIGRISGHLFGAVPAEASA
jgi:protein-tyrosine-phosphatase